MGGEEWENSATFYRGEMQPVKGTPFGEGRPDVYTFTRYKFMVHSKSRGWLKQRFPIPPEIDKDYEARASQFQVCTYISPCC